ncbi:MAG: helix-turn-helix domain-containing protein [Verrucomicrobia bacterium]|nr:helix-turn-helix domain-containing protein [Verrucomicrobiota bacterium]
MADTAAQPPPLSIQRAREGFPGQHLVVLPGPVIQQAGRNALLADLFPTAAGFFPKAPGHLVERERGLVECIMIRVVSGAGWVRTRERHELGAGQWVLIPAGVPHAYGADETTPWSIQWVHFQGRASAAFAALLGAGTEVAVLAVPRSGAQNLDLARLYEGLEQGYTQPNLLAAAAQLRQVLTELECSRRLGQPTSASEAVAASLAWMSEHLAARADLGALAGAAGLSVPHYSDLFRRATGYPPVEHFLRLKIQRACQLLDTTDMRVHEVAAAVGWTDPFYFSRFFRKITGQSPRAYRQVVKS